MTLDMNYLADLNWLFSRLLSVCTFSIYSLVNPFANLSVYFFAFEIT